MDLITIKQKLLGGLKNNFGGDFLSYKSNSGVHLLLHFNRNCGQYKDICLGT